MKRLTSNKEVSKMGMYELAHNSCYAKDRKARFRDFENDFDARELTIKLLEKHADIPNEFTCDEDFDDFIMDSLQYGEDDILGLIAVFYRNLWAMADLRERLKEYEDLEEQGKLLKLPCKLGNTIYWIDDEYDEIRTDSPITGIAISADGFYVTCEKHHEGYSKVGSEFALLTRQEAEDKLKEMEGENLERS